MFVSCPGQHLQDNASRESRNQRIAACGRRCSCLRQDFGNAMFGQIFVKFGSVDLCYPTAVFRTLNRSLRTSGSILAATRRRWLANPRGSHVGPLGPGPPNVKPNGGFHVSLFPQVLRGSIGVMPIRASQGRRIHASIAQPEAAGAGGGTPKINPLIAGTDGRAGGRWKHP